MDRLLFFPNDCRGTSVQRESMERTTLLQSIPDDHVANFHYMEMQEIYGITSDAREFALMGVTSEAYKNSIKTLEKQKRVLQRNQLTLEDKIMVLSIELENTSNLLKHSERTNADVENAKKYLKTKLENHLARTEKLINSSKNLFKLIDSSMYVRTKVGRPIFNRFAKTDSMKAVPPPLTGEYTSLSDHTDLDESQMYYGTKSSTSCDLKYVPNDFVSCDDSDKSSEVNTNDLASSDSSLKSLEHKPTDSTSCASTSSVSTSVNEAEIASNVRTPIKEPISVQGLPSFTCNCSDKNEHTSRTSCNKNGSFNKTAGYFRIYASSVSKLCFVCGSGTHLIKDYDFYEKQMTNRTIVPTGKPKVTPVPTGKTKVTPVSTGKPRVKPVPTGKPKVTLVPTGKPQVSTPVPIGRLNRPFLVSTDRGYTPSESPFSATEDEGCSRSMTGNKERLDDFHAFHGGKVTFGGGEGRITGKGTTRTPTLDFENVYYLKELQQFNLFSISQICDKKNQVLFTDTKCLVLFKDFKLQDDSMVVLKVPRKHKLYTINLNDLCPRGNLACLVAHASFDESVKWHRWMAHVNYKNMNRLVKGNLVRGLPPKLFKNGHTCVACCKGKQHKASYKTINAVSFISEPLQLLHMDLFGPTSIRSIDHKYYCLVITDAYRIRMEYSNPKTPQQNRVAERKNRTLIEAGRTMLADSKLPTMFWNEAVQIACYVLNRVSVTSPHNKTPYALLTGNIPSVSHFKPFGCHVTILNTSDNLGKFDGKADEGYIVGYSASNKAYRVYNVPNKWVEESMNLRFLKEKPNVQGLGHEWYFDLDYLTNSLGYKHVLANQPAGTQRATTNSVGTQDADSDSDCDEQVILVPSYPSHSIQGSQPIDTPIDKVDHSPFSSVDEIFQKELTRMKGKEQRDTSYADSPALGTANNAADLQTPQSANPVPPGYIPVPTGKVPVPTGSLPVPTSSIPVPAATAMVHTDDVPVHTSSSTDSIFYGEPTIRFPCLFDLGNHNPLPSIFSSSSYDWNIAQALEDPTWVDAMQDEMQQFKFQNVWVLVDLPTGKYAIGTKQEEGIDYDEVFAPVARIEAIGLVLAFASYMGFLVYQMDVKSAFLYGRIGEELYVTQPKCFMDHQHPKKVYKVVKALYGLHQAPRAWYATLSTFLLKHGHRRGTIDKTLFLKKNNKDIILVQVYVDDIIFGSTKKAWCDEFEALMKGEFQMSAMGELTFFLDLQVQQRPDGIFIHQDKYVQEILNKFDLGSIRTETTPYEAPKPKSKNESDSAVNVHLYRSMIGSLMYLTASRPDIMFAVSTCLRHQVTPTTSNLEAVKKIFKYLKGQPKLGLWYPKESPLVLEAYSGSDYAGANKDRKSTIGGSEYVAAANCCAQTKHIEIRHHFIRDAHEKKLIQVLKMRTNDNVADLLTKAFDGPRWPYLDVGVHTGSAGVPSGIARVPAGYFWSTATLRALELGPPAILAIIDKTPYTITKELVRSRLQLADDEVFTSMEVFSPYPTSLSQHQVWKLGSIWGMVSNIRNAKKFLMYPRFLQTILGIETRVIRQYTVLAFTSKLFANMRLNFAGHPMPLLPAMLLQAHAGGGAEVAEQAVSHPMPAPDHSLAHLPTPSRPQTSDPVALVLEHDHSLDPNEAATGSFLTREDAPLGGDFHTSPPRPSHAPLAGQPSGGAKDPITLTTLYNVVSTLVQKVHSLEAELHDHKKLFKDVVGKLVKKVKTLEVKLKTKKRKMVVSDSDHEDDTTQNVDLDALRALANAAMAADSDIPSGSTSQIPTASPSVPTVGPPDTSGVPPATSAIPSVAFDAPTGGLTVLHGALNFFATASAVPADSPNVPAAVSADSPTVPASVSSKGKSPMVDKDIPIKARTFRHMEEDRLGEEAAKRMHDEEMAQMERERVEAQRKRQQDFLDSAMYYNESDWLNIRAQFKANASLSKTLLDDDVTKENFPARMAALIKKKRQALAEQLFKERQNRPMTLVQQKAYMRQYVKNQSSAIYNTGWTMAYVKSFSDEQLKQEFEKIRKVQSHSQIQAFSQTLKRSGPVLKEPSTKWPKYPEAPTPSMPEVPISPAVTSSPSSRTRRKSLGRKHMHKPKSPLLKLDLDAPAQTFLKVVVDEDSDDEDSVDEVWSAVVRWEVLPTLLGEINALYRIDGSTKHFATLCQILYMVDRLDLMKLYGLVVQYYKHHPAAGAGLLFWGDLQVLFDSQAGGKGFCVWQNQHLWEIRSWCLYTLLNVHVLETVSGEVFFMFTDVSYPLLVKLIRRMLMHKLEIDSDFVGNDLTTAEQLIQFIKNQLVAAQASSV
nr:hypothetical protein [Tanacetum cinerariifolium]